MIIMIVGRPKHGKTGWLQMKIEETYHEQGRELLKQCCRELDKLNAARETPLEYPKKPPIYAPLDMGSRFRVRRDEYFKPYVINPFHLSTTNKGVAPQYLLPYAQIFIPEAQKYFSSKQHQNLDPGVYGTFEKHGHARFNIYLDSQVGGFVDSRIRQLAEKIIEIMYQTNIYDCLGGIIKTIWHCREFDSIQDYDAYFRNSEIKTYKETTYEYPGDIRTHYNAFGCKAELTPPDGEQYSMLEPLSEDEIRKLPEAVAQYYSLKEPEYYRKKPPEPKTDEKGVKKVC